MAGTPGLDEVSAGEGACTNSAEATGRGAGVSPGVGAEGASGAAARSDPPVAAGGCCGGAASTSPTVGTAAAPLEEGVMGVLDIWAS